jgi:hypothetical protein
MEQVLSWEVLGWVVGLSIPLGLGVLALDEFRAAKICFLVAAIILAMKDAYWEVITNRPWYVRLPISIVLIGLIGGMLIESLRWVDRRGFRNKPATGETIPAAPDHDIELPPAGFIAFLGQVLNGYAPMIQV